MHNYQSLINIPGLHVVKDCNGKYIHASQDWARHLGYETSIHLLESEITDYNIQSKAVEMAETFVKEDRDVFLTRETLKILYFCCYASDQWTLLLSEKSLTYDNQQEPHLFVSAIDITSSEISKKFLAMVLEQKKYKKEQFSYYLKPNLDEKKFSRRESECLYFILRGKACSEIASLLKINRRTVEVYVDNLKNKLKVCNKSQLIEKALSFGYYYIVPESVISYL